MSTETSPTMFSVRVDPVVYPAITIASIRDDLCSVIAFATPHRPRVSCFQESGLGVWRFRVPLARLYQRNPSLRAQFMHAISETVRAFLETVTDELRELADADTTYMLDLATIDPDPRVEVERLSREQAIDRYGRVLGASA